MKTLFRYTIVLTVLVVAFSPRAGAQHYLGARGGYGSGTARFYPKEETKTMWGLYSGGVSWKYYSAERYLGGVEVDAMWMQQGFSVRRRNSAFPEDATSMYHRKVDMIMVPICWQPHVYLFRQNVRVFLNLGVTFSYNLSSEDMWDSDINGTIQPWEEYEFITVRDNRFAYGLMGGGGIGWSTGRLEIFGEVRYYIGYGDLLRNRNKYPDNPLRSPLDGLQIQAGFYYRLGKGGVLSQQVGFGRKKPADPGQEQSAGRAADKYAPVKDSLTSAGAPGQPVAAPPDEPVRQEDAAASPRAEKTDRREAKKQAREAKKEETAAPEEVKPASKGKTAAPNEVKSTSKDEKSTSKEGKSRTSGKTGKGAVTPSPASDPAAPVPTVDPEEVIPEVPASKPAPAPAPTPAPATSGR